MRCTGCVRSRERPAYVSTSLLISRRDTFSWRRGKRPARRHPTLRVCSLFHFVAVLPWANCRVVKHTNVNIRPTSLQNKVVSPKFLLIECAVGAERLARSTVRIRNIGSTVLFFTWSRVRGGGTIVSLNGETDCAYFARNENDGPSGGGHHACEKENRVVSKEMGRQPTNLSATAAGLTGHASLQSPDSRFFCHQV